MYNLRYGLANTCSTIRFALFLDKLFDVALKEFFSGYGQLNKIFFCRYLSVSIGCTQRCNICTVRCKKTDIKSVSKACKQLVYD